MMKDNRKKRTSEIVTCILLVLGIVLVIVSGYFIVRTLWDYHEGVQEYEELRQKVFQEEKENDPGKDFAKEKSPGTQETGGDDSAWSPNPSVCGRITQLREENDDVIGWISFDTLDLSYPIVQGETNEDYLRHTVSGEANEAGSIFMESLNSPDFEDSHTLIYGHNMKNDSMFGKLKNYKQIENYYQDHQYFTIYTPNKIYRYRIFAFYDVSESGFVFDIFFDSADDFQELIDTMQRSSYEATGVNVGASDKIITLSTCSVSGARFVLNAVRVEETAAD